jgi:hypothetical protein
MARSTRFAARPFEFSRKVHRKKPTRLLSRKAQRLNLESLEDRWLLAANVVTDQLDYAPGETAQIVASDFAVGETVRFQVLHTDDTPNTGGGHEPWLVTDGVMGDFDGDGSIEGDLDGVADGNIHTTWYVNPDDSADAAFELTATGLSSGFIATHAFTDSVSFTGTPSVSSSSSSRSSATLSNHTVPAGTDRLLMVTVLTRGDEDVSSITFDGQAFTQAIERDGGDDDETAVEIWYLKLGTSASSTTDDVVVNFSSNVDPSYVRADNLAGVDQAMPIGATAGAFGNDDDVSVNVTTTTAGSLIYGAVAMYGGDTDPFETGSGLTQLFDTATGTSTGSFGTADIGVWGAFRIASMPGTYNFSAEANNGDDYAAGVIEIRMTQVAPEMPAINVVKRVNGNDANTTGTGPTLAAGGSATFTYSVTNTGNVSLSNVVIVDDNGTPGIAGDNFSPAFTGGDTNSNGRLDLTETWTFSATRTVVAGQYTNIATASGRSPGNTTVNDTDPANYFGAAPGINIIKKVNGLDANSASGPIIPVGSVASFTYQISNTGNIVLGSIAVVDDHGTPGNMADDFSPAYQSGDANSNGRLDLGETWTYVATHTVVVGQYANTGKVTGSVAATGQTASDTDVAHHFGKAAPEILTLAITSPINENGTATLSGTYIHDGLFSSHQLDIDWDGDGQYDQTVTVSGGSFSVSRQFLDDNPTGTAGDTHSVNVRLREDPEFHVIFGGQTITALYSELDTHMQSALDAEDFIAVDSILGAQELGTQLMPNGPQSDIGSASLTVSNVAPEILSLSITTPINEGGTATLTGTFTDVGTLDTHELDIDWDGDGDYDQTIAVTGGSFSIGHQFLDDNPTGTASDTHNVNVRLRDDDHFDPEVVIFFENATISVHCSELGTYLDSAIESADVLAIESIVSAIAACREMGAGVGFDAASVSLTVNNIAPELLTLSITTPIYVNDTAALSGTYSDIGSLDTHLLDIDWDGNGSYDQTVAVTGGSFSVGHTFTTAGNFTVSTRLRDDDTGSNTASVELVVRNRPIIVLAPDKGNTSKPIVKVLNQETGKIVSQFYAYEGKFLGGVQVATGDMTGDGIDEIIVAPGQGRVGEVRVFTQQGVELTQFRVQPYGSKYVGGVEVAVGDVNGDGRSDIVTATKTGRPDIRVFYNHFSPANPWGDAIADAPSKQLYAFSSKFKGGADVAVADMGTFYNGVIYDAYTPDGKSEIIVGNGPGMQSTIDVYDVSAAPKIVDTILPLSSSFKGGITLSTARVNGDAIPDIIVAAGNGGGSVVETWSGLVNDAHDVRLSAFSAFGDLASRNMPVHATALDTTGDGIADLLAVVQGTNGTSNQVRYFKPNGTLHGARYGLMGPWNIASLSNVDLLLPINTFADVEAKDDVYTEIGTQTTPPTVTKAAKKAAKKKK